MNLGVTEMRWCVRWVPLEQLLFGPVSAWLPPARGLGLFLAGWRRSGREDVGFRYGADSVTVVGFRHAAREAYSMPERAQACGELRMCG